MIWLVILRIIALAFIKLTVLLISLLYAMTSTVLMSKVKWATYIVETRKIHLHSIEYGPACVK